MRTSKEYKELIDRIMAYSKMDNKESAEIASNTASAFLAIESIKQLKDNTRNNILFVLLGGFLGFITSISTALITEDKQQEKLQQINKKLLEVESKLENFQNSHSKKDSLQIFLKKN